MRNIKDVRQSIPTVDTLILCFKMESYFTDDKFFKYLMSKAYPVWEEFYPRIHELPDEYLVYLYTPYEFVPDVYILIDHYFSKSGYKLTKIRELCFMVKRYIIQIPSTTIILVMVIMVNKM